MTKKEYDKCIDEWYGVVCGDPDQIYSDYVSCILHWQDEGIINLEYLLDNFITVDDVNNHIIEELKKKELSDLKWIQELDFDREYFVIDDDESLHNLTMSDIVKLEKKIMSRLQANVYDHK